jgi:hypothetical protein
MKILLGRYLLKSKLCWQNNLATLKEAIIWKGDYQKDEAGNENIKTSDKPSSIWLKWSRTFFPETNCL